MPQAGCPQAIIARFGNQGEIDISHSKVGAFRWVFWVAVRPGAIVFPPVQGGT
jgi:hypothetical protein